MGIFLSGEGVTSYLTDVSSVLSTVTTTITGSPILMTMFATGLIAVGAKAFKKIKNSVK